MKKVAKITLQNCLISVSMIIDHQLGNVAHGLYLTKHSYTVQRVHKLPAVCTPLYTIHNTWHQHGVSGGFSHYLSS